jgi:gluconokinase
VYASLLPVFAELYNALVPTFTSLRRLAPSLPIDLDLGEGRTTADPSAEGNTDR